MIAILLIFPVLHFYGFAGSYPPLLCLWFSTITRHAIKLPGIAPDCTKIMSSHSRRNTIKITIIIDFCGYYQLNFQEVSSLVDVEYGETNQTSSIMSTMVNGQYISLNTAQDDTYLDMKSLSPAIIPINDDDLHMDYDNIIKKMIEGISGAYFKLFIIVYFTIGGPTEEIYETLTHPTANHPLNIPHKPYLPSPLTRSLDGNYI